MKPIIGGLVGLLVGSTLGWLGFGTTPGAIGLGFAVAATLYGLLSAFDP
jgi:hypothetical protein